MLFGRLLDVVEQLSTGKLSMYRRMSAGSRPICFTSWFLCKNQDVLMQDPDGNAITFRQPTVSVFRRCATSSECPKDYSDSSSADGLNHVGTRCHPAYKLNYRYAGRRVTIINREYSVRHQIAIKMFPCSAVCTVRIKARHRYKCTVMANVTRKSTFWSRPRPTY